MIIKKLTLKNFRQFWGKHEIVFSTDPEKKTTIIIADNTSGKTTLLESFSWIFYGTHNLGNIINAAEKEKMAKDTSFEIYGTVELIHDEKEYTITRRQVQNKRKKDVYMLQDVLEVKYKELDGRSKSVRDVEAAELVERIVPKHLFEYFFFKGEKIEEIGNEIARKRTNERSEFVKAVRGLLGFDYYYDFRDYIREAIKNYNNRLASSADKKISEMSSAILEINKEINEQESQLNTYTDQYEEYSDIMTNITNEIILKAPGDIGEKQKEVKTLESQYKILKEHIHKAQKTLFASFSNNSRSFFQKNLIKNAQIILEDSDSLIKSVPGIDSRSIDHIILEGKCVCGTTVLENSKEHKHLIQVKEFIPPQYIGNVINIFVNDLENNEKLRMLYLEDFNDKDKNISIDIKALNDLKTRIETLNTQIGNSPDVSELTKKQEKAKEMYESFVKKASNCKTEIERLEKEKNIIEKERNAYVTLDETNKRIKTYIEVATSILMRVEEFLEQRETEIRNRLIDAINKTFKSIFDVNIKLVLDEDYNVSVEFEESAIKADVDQSTSEQGILAFAFIAGIIELAKEKVHSEAKIVESLEDELISEPYPLVMDAPSSSFDKKRIEKFSLAVSKIAEQVIIFIKDTDGDYAKQHLLETIGKEYTLFKEGDHYSRIVEVKL